MAKQGLIGVVTVTYNSAAVLPGFLPSILKQTHADFLLYAVDNALTDDTVNILRQCPDARLKIISNSDNKGVAEGNNQGIRAALQDGCASILLINNDTEFDECLVAQLVRGLDEFQVGMICPKIMYFDEPQRFWAAGGTLQAFLGYRPVHLGVDEIDRGQYDSPRLVGYVPTCCV